MVLAQSSIYEARLLPPGTSVTVTGIVTNGYELGNIRYLQDVTAGIAAFPGSGSVAGFAEQVERGDSIVVTGVLVDFNGLLEISPITDFQVINKGNILPAPLELTFEEVDESKEGMLARFQAVKFVETGYFAANATYTLQDQSNNEIPLYIRTNHPLVGHQIPTGEQDVIAIISDYFEFQLLPRDSFDLVPVGELFFTHLVEQTDLTTNSLSIQWATNIPSSAVIQIETLDGIIRQDTLLNLSANHNYVVTNLEEATLYYVQVFAERPGIQLTGNRQMMTTSSSIPGKIEVFFNNSIDASYSTGPIPITSSGDEILDELLSLIQSATQTIDICIYNINEAIIVQYLTAAFDKGVQVRFIAADATGNTALDPLPAFPVIFGNTIGLMHNKFVIIDAALPEQAAVFMGSMNFTTPQIFDHPNNMVLIHDQTFAKAYTFEFNEMWGSEGLMPIESESRFGSNKKNNTPHLFRINETLIESYFSPSDNTNRQILSEIEEMQNNMEFALLTFTKDDLAAAMIDRFNVGHTVRGIIDNINDNGSEFYVLLNAGIEVKDHAPTTLLHHKYAILDNNRVITGSHNWSNAANQVNDENTVVIHDEDIANLYLQEFQARWNELSVAIDQESYRRSLFIEGVFGQSGMWWIRINAEENIRAHIQVYDMLGQLVHHEDELHVQDGISWYALMLPDLTTGTYVIRLSDTMTGEHTARKFNSGY